MPRSHLSACLLATYQYTTLGMVSRVRRTHKLLWQALMTELSERAFEEITVKEICERAMVHRTTFYKHYEDKYALLEQGNATGRTPLTGEIGEES